jgi:defect-in-organelle-trafficking protein DotB
MLDIAQDVKDEYFFTVPPVIMPETLEQLLVHAVKFNASDITIQQDLPVYGEIYGFLYPLTRRSVSENEVRQIVTHIYGSNAIAMLASGQDLDKLYEYSPQRGTRYRFRMNATAINAPGGDGVQVTLRSIPTTPPSLDALGIEKEIRDNIAPAQGLVLVVGATGSGKSTLLSANIRNLLECDESYKILTYEAPIEFVYDEVKWKNSVISQTEIPRQLPSFERGVRNALRRKPAIILVGESRDKETVRAAVEASMTGHLVYSTVHANGVAETIKRLVNVFEPGERHAMAYDIIDSMRLIVAQRLVRSSDGKRVALREYLAFDQQLRDRLLEMSIEKAIAEVRRILKAKRQTLVDAANRAHEDGKLNAEDHRKIVVGLVGAIERDEAEEEAQ